MKINENPEELLYYIIRRKDDDKQIKFSVCWDTPKREEIIPDFKDLRKENNENYTTRIYYFKKNDQKIQITLTLGPKSFNLNNINFDQIFHYNDWPKIFSIIEMSLYEKYKSYKQFVEMLSSASPKLKEIFYEDCVKLCSNNLNFLIFLDTLEYYKNNEKLSNKLFVYLSQCSQFDNFDIKMLQNSEKNYIELIEYFTQNKNLNSQNNEDKGKKRALIIIYMCLSFEDKFKQYYHNNKKDKKSINYELNQIQSVEELYIEKKIRKKIETSNKKDKVYELIKRCKYFSDFIFLFSLLIKNPNNFNFDFSKKYYEITNEDNIELIIKRYKEIKNKINSFSINKKIWQDYCLQFQSKNNLNNLLLLKDVIDDKENFISSINQVIKNIIADSNLSNLEICKIIQKNLTSNLDWMKGKINLNLANYFDLEDLSDEVIKEFKNCKLNELYEEQNLFLEQNFFILKSGSLKILENTLKLFNFDYNLKKKEEKNRFEEIIKSIINIIGNIFKNYKEYEEKYLYNIINFMLSIGIGSNQIKELILTIRTKLPFNHVLDILTTILNENIIKYKDINNDIINYLFENSLNKNKIDVLLTKIKNKTYLKYILTQKDLKSQKFLIPIPQKSDFLQDEDCKSLIILGKFIEDGHFENTEFTNEGYGKETLKLLKEMKNNFIDKNFRIDECEKIFELNKKNILDSRLKLIFFREEDKPKINEIKPELIETIEKALDIKQNIYNNSNYLNFFFVKNKRIEEYQNLKKTISEKNLKDFEQLKEEAPDYDILKKVGTKIMEFTKSKVFMSIFNYLKNNSKDDPDKNLLHTIQKYNQFFEIIKNKVIENDDEEILNIVSNSFNTFDELKENIQVISNLENNNDDLLNLLLEDKANNTIEKIFFFHRKSEFNDFMKSFEKFNHIFQNSNNFKDECEKLRSKLRESKVLPNFDAIKEIIIKWDEALFLEKQDYEKIFNQLLSNEKLLKFIKEKDNNDIMNLQELIDPSQSQVVTVNDINDLEDLINLKDGLKKISNLDSFVQEYSSLISQLYPTKNEKEKLLKKIKNVSDKTNDLIEIFNKKLNKNVFAEQKFDAISQNGIFNIEYEPNKGYKCIVITQIPNDEDNDEKDNKEENKIEENKIKYKIVKDNFEEIKRFKDLLLLIKKEESQKKTEVKKKVIEIIEEVEKIINKLTNIINKGYDEDVYNHIEISLLRKDNPEKLKVSQSVEKSREFIFEEKYVVKSKKYKKEGDKVKELSDILSQEEELQEKKEKEIYVKSPFTRLIYGSQFNKIYKYVKYFYDKNNINGAQSIIFDNNIENNEEKEKEIKEYYKKCEEEVIYLNKFITNNTVKKINDYEYKEEKDVSGIIDVYTIVKNYLNKLLGIEESNKLNKKYDELFENAKIKADFNKKKNEIKPGFFPYTSSTPEIDTIRIFKYLTGNLPIAQNVLICNENSTNEEILAFLYRAFYDEEYRLYVIINSEQLNVEKTNKLISLIKEFKNDKTRSMKALVIFINKKDICDISEQIRELNDDKELKDGKNIDLQKMRTKKDLIENITNNNTEIIYSFKPGVGKSKYIKTYYEKTQKNYVYFPVGGDLNLEDLLFRLKQAIKRREVGLHIDILETDSEEIIEIINHFLFSFLVMNYFSVNGDILYIKNNEIDIKVEVPASLVDNFIKFPLLNYFKKKGIYKVSIGKFNIYLKQEVLEAHEQWIKKREKQMKIKNIKLKNQPIKTKFSDIIENEKIFNAFEKKKNYCLWKIITYIYKKMIQKKILKLRETFMKLIKIY